MLNKALEDYHTRKAPYTVTVFNTDEACLENLYDARDVIVLDYYLNSIQKDAADGIEILETIKKQLPKTHVIMLSSQEHNGIAMQTLINGAEQYVIKHEQAFEKIAQIIKDI